MLGKRLDFPTRKSSQRAIIEETPPSPTTFSARLRQKSNHLTKTFPRIPQFELPVTPPITPPPIGKGETSYRRMLDSEYVQRAEVLNYDNLPPSPPASPITRTLPVTKLESPLIGPSHEKLSLSSNIFGFGFSFDEIPNFAPTTSAIETPPATPVIRRRKSRANITPYTPSDSTAPPLPLSPMPSLKGLNNEDDRVGSTDTVWIGRFPDVGEEFIAEGDFRLWNAPDWAKLRSYLRARGYEIDLGDVIKTIPAIRISDKFPLILQFIETTESTEELDILENLNSENLRFLAKRKGVKTTRPIIGIVPLNSDWSIIFYDSAWCEQVFSGRTSRVDFGNFAKDLTGAVAVLHEKLIAHLSIHRDAIAICDHRYSLKSYENAFQSDPFNQSLPIDTFEFSGAFEVPGLVHRDGDLEFGQVLSTEFDVFKFDLYCVGKLLNDVATISAANSPELQAIILQLTRAMARDRISASKAHDLVLQLFPA